MTLEERVAQRRPKAACPGCGDHATPKCGRCHGHGTILIYVNGPPLNIGGRFVRTLSSSCPNCAGTGDP